MNSGIIGPLWLLLQDYLTDKCQLTSIGGVSSSQLPVTSGSPPRKYPWSNDLLLSQSISLNIYRGLQVHAHYLLPLRMLFTLTAIHNNLRPGGSKFKSSKTSSHNCLLNITQSELQLTTVTLLLTSQITFHGPIPFLHYH